MRAGCINARRQVSQAHAREMDPPGIDVRAESAILRTENAVVHDRVASLHIAQVDWEDEGDSERAPTRRRRRDTMGSDSDSNNSEPGPKRIAMGRTMEMGLILNAYPESDDDEACDGPKPRVDPNRAIHYNAKMEKEERYKDGKVYTLEHEETGDVYYVGSTTGQLHDRLRDHRSCVQSRDSRIYRFLREVTDVDKVIIRLRRLVPCTSRRELLDAEEAEVLLHGLPNLFNTNHPVGPWNMEQHQAACDRIDAFAKTVLTVTPGAHLPLRDRWRDFTSPARFGVAVVTALDVGCSRNVFADRICATYKTHLGRGSDGTMMFMHLTAKDSNAHSAIDGFLDATIVHAAPMAHVKVRTLWIALQEHLATTVSLDPKCTRQWFVSRVCTRYGLRIIKDVKAVQFFQGIALRK